MVSTDHKSNLSAVSCLVRDTVLPFTPLCQSTDAINIPSVNLSFYLPLQDNPIVHSFTIWDDPPFVAITLVLWIFQIILS
jgi:hypothetical protein